MKLSKRALLVAFIAATLLLSACEESVTPTAATAPPTNTAAITTANTPVLQPSATSVLAEPEGTIAIPATATAVVPATATATIVAPTATTLPLPTPSPTPSISADPTLTGTLVLWHGWTGAEAAALDRAIALFNSFYPNVTVDLEQIRVDQLQTRFAAESATGGPDLLFGTPDWLAPWADAGLVLPLDDTLAPIRSRILPATLDALTYKGKLFGAPATYDTLALFYNKKLVKSVPKTTDELLKGAATGGGLAFVTDFFHNAGLLGSFGGSLFDAQGCATIGDAEGTAFLSYLKSLKSAPGVTSDTGDQTLGPGFATGQYGMIINGPWAIADYRGGLGADLAAAPLPAGPGGAATPLLEVRQLMMNSNISAEQQALAATFIRFYLSPENQGLMMREAGHLPVNIDVDAGGDPVVVGFVAGAKTALPLPLTGEMDAVWAPMDAAVLAVTSGQQEPAEAASEAAAAINSSLGKSCTGQAP